MGIQYLNVVDFGCSGIYHSKYLKSIHYDTIEDGQNKTVNIFSLNIGSREEPPPNPKSDLATSKCNVRPHGLIWIDAPTHRKDEAMAGLSDPENVPCPGQYTTTK